jgi:hypothetical protein
MRYDYDDGQKRKELYSSGCRWLKPAGAPSVLPLRVLQRERCQTGK